MIYEKRARCEPCSAGYHISMMTAASIVDEALALPLPERSYVAERLLLSLDEDRPLSDEWRAEIARRVARRAAGESRPFSREEVRRDAQALVS